jgi:orotate phosphoribosyltransferase
MSYTPLARRMVDVMTTHGYRWSSEGFTLKSGRKSNHYVDCRRVLLDPAHRQLAAQLIKSVMDVNAVAGVVLGGVPLADAVSDLLGVPAVYVRPEPKGHGTQKLIEATSDSVRGVRAVLLEDVLTTGGSAKKAIDALRAHGFEVKDLICLVDRSEKGHALTSEELGVNIWRCLVIGQIEAENEARGRAGYP